jgi:hypothetical protein
MKVKRELATEEKIFTTSKAKKTSFSTLQTAEEL